MNIEKLLADHHIPYVTEHKNVRSGWIGIHCPFCRGEQNYHLGYCLDENYFSCWRCGGKAQEQAVAKLLSVNYDRAEELIKQYGGASKPKAHTRVKVGTNKFKLPSGPLVLTNAHMRYLTRRGYDWEKIFTEWGIMGTGPFSKVDNLNYSNRILAPIYWDGRIVSYQGRDITNKHIAKYMACPPERERISHKHILYGIQGEWGRRGICVEGIFDAWRLGPQAFATFGIKFTRPQIHAMTQHFDEIVIVYDPDRMAQWQARQLVGELTYRTKIKAYIEKIDSDPGDLSQDDADHLVQHILTQPK